MQLSIVDAPEGASISLDRTMEDVQRSKIALVGGTSGVTQAIDNSVSRITGQSDLYHAVGKLLSRVDAVAGVIGPLSEVSHQIVPHKQFAEVA